MKTERIGIRVSSKLKARIKKEAEKENRSISNLVVTILESHFKENEPEETKDG